VRIEERAFDASTRSLAIARQQFSLGAVSYLALLNAQQSLPQAIMGRAQALTNRYADTIALYQALGGTALVEPQK
jgi:outer membrane protein TolC